MYANFTRIAEPALSPFVYSDAVASVEIALILLLRVIQTKLYDLENQVRRGAAERGAAEVKNNEFQDEIQRQKEQMEHLESLYKRQMEGAQNMCTQEKVHTNNQWMSETVIATSMENVNVENFFFLFF